FRHVVKRRTEERDDAIANHLVEDAVMLPYEIDGSLAPCFDELSDFFGRLEHLLGDAREARDVDVENADDLFARCEVLRFVVVAPDETRDVVGTERSRETPPFFVEVDDALANESGKSREELAIPRVECTGLRRDDDFSNDDRVRDAVDEDF